MAKKIYRVTFEDGEQRLGQGFDCIGAICKAVQVANQERAELAKLEGRPAPDKKLSSRNVAQVQLISAPAAAGQEAA